MTGKIEEFNEIIDKAADRLPSSREPSKERDVFARKLLHYFPYFVGVCIILWLVIIITQGMFDFSRLIEVLCLVFVTAFAILGVPCAYFSDKGVFSMWAAFGFTILMTCIMWVIGTAMGQVYCQDAVSGVMLYLGISLPASVEFVLGFLAMLCILFFTSMGVTSVVSAYMRRYIPDVFLAMQKNVGKGSRGSVEKFFMVPEIIDVKEVVVEPVRNHYKFDFRTSLSMSLYMFLLGLMLSSYVFLNPLLIDVLGWRTMLAIMLMLSMFTPALLIPWLIVREVGAKVRSDAPRDYYLWKGAKSRLFSAFATLGVFMMLLGLALAFGNNVLDIIRVYVSFMLPLLIISLTYGVLYTNSFHASVRDSICESFNEKKESCGKI